MATYCKKCGYRLSLIDIKPECPVCKVNLVYYGMEDTLRHEADKAEFEHACLQPRLDRLKASTIGSPLSVVRMVLVLVPVLAMLIPMAKVTVTLPFTSDTTTVNLVSVITEGIMKLDFGMLLSLAKSQTLGSAYVFYLIALLSVLLIVVLSLVNVVSLLMSCGKRGIRRNITVSSIGLALAVLGSVSLGVWISSMNAAAPEIFSGSVIFAGPIVVCLGFAAQIAVNIICKKKGIKVKYKDVSEFLLPYEEREKLREQEGQEEQKTADA